MAKKHLDQVQYAALPYRIDADGSRHIMLLTSRETRRWVIPKGWPIKGLKPAEVAAREAFEEAGLIGTIVGKHPIGAFHYEKRLIGHAFLCEVSVFLLSVERQLTDWPEKDQRQTRWFNADEAADQVDEGGLAEVIRNAIPGNRATVLS